MSAAFLMVLLPLFVITACYEPVAGPALAAAGLRVVSTTPVNAAAGIPVASNVTATFNETMDPASITSATFTLTGPGTTPISGVFTLNAAGTTAAFDPDGDLPPGTQCTATVTTGAKSLQGDPLSRNHVWRFTTAAAPDITAPSVASTIPAGGTPDAAINANITATFSEAMNPATFNTATFTVTGPGATPISGTVSCSGNTATFNPDADLPSLTLCTATVLAGVADLAGNALASDYTWTFTTAAAPDTTPPVISIGPISTSNPSPGWAREGDTMTVSFTVTDADSSVAGTPGVFVGGQAATVSGTYPNYNALYIFSGAAVPEGPVPCTINAVDIAGNAVTTGSVLTGIVLDRTAPMVAATNPTPSATGVPIGMPVTATFSEAVDPANVSIASFIVISNYLGTPISGSVSLTGGNTAEFQSFTELPPGHPITARITAEVKDFAGNMMTGDYEWYFTTVPAVTSPVGLGTAGGYTILAGVGISNISPSNIFGNIGISPSLASDITGFSLDLDIVSGKFATSSQVIGSVYAADYAAPTPASLTQAVSDFNIAYTDAAGRVPNFVDYLGGNISGWVLAPGVYRWNSPVTISAPVILQGGPGDVFIFQIGDGLWAQSDIQLGGGVSAANVFWQVSGGTVNIGTSGFTGIVLSLVPIILGGGAEVNGRLLTTAGVDLNANTVTPP